VKDQEDLMTSNRQIFIPNQTLLNIQMKVQRLLPTTASQTLTTQSRVVQNSNNINRTDACNDNIVMFLEFNN
jgi:hypothetical protein